MLLWDRIREYDMAKIAKITLDGYFNYGNVLQRYALQHVLSSYADDVVDVIRNDNDPQPTNLTWWSVRKLAKFVLNWHGYRNFVLGHMPEQEKVRQKRIKHFVQTRTKYVDAMSARQMDAAYDYVVVGSDQVWNPYFGRPDVFTLRGISPEKRIAYAASLGIPDIPEKFRPIFKEEVQKFKAVSVREEQAKVALERLTGRMDIVVVPDPTLVLSKEEWGEIAERPKWLGDEKYLLTYFLGPKPDFLEKLSKELGLKLIQFLGDDFDSYVTSPEEFVYLISHASLVYTDSFHGTVFSILHDRPFVVCDRIGDQVSANMGSRIDTLLRLFHLEERRGTAANHYQIENPLEITYKDKEKILKEQRQKADDFLRKALNLK